MKATTIPRPKFPQTHKKTLMIRSYGDSKQNNNSNKINAQKCLSPLLEAYL